MIQVDVFRQTLVPISRLQVKKIVALTAKKESAIRGIVEVIWVDAREMKRLNKLYRGFNKTTDVLSFAWQEDNAVHSDFLGQIYLCYSQIKKQAILWQVPTREEMVRMLVHGLLHLINYDHQTDQMARLMFDRQEKIIKYILESLC